MCFDFSTTDPSMSVLCAFVFIIGPQLVLWASPSFVWIVCEKDRESVYVCV